MVLHFAMKVYHRQLHFAPTFHCRVLTMQDSPSLAGLAGVQRSKACAWKGSR